MDDYLVKPIHAEELMAMIQKWAGSRGQAQEGAQGPSAAIQSMLEVLDGDAELAGELLAAFIQDVKGKLPTWWRPSNKRTITGYAGWPMG